MLADEPPGNGFEDCLALTSESPAAPATRFVSAPSGRVAQSGELDALTGVYAANILAHEQEREHGVGGPGEEIFDPNYVSKMGLEGCLAAWREDAARRLSG